MQVRYSVVQWSVLVGLRLFTGSELLFAGLAKLGAFGWAAVTQPHPGSLLLQALAMIEPAPGLIASAEGILGTLFAAAGCTLVLGWFAREATFLALHLVALGLLMQLPVPSFVSFADAVTLMSDDLNLCAALAVLLVFPTSHVFGLDALRARGRGAPARVQAGGPGQ